MPDTIIMTGPDTFVVRGSPAQIVNPPDAASRALPAGVSVVRTDNPPPIPYRPGPDINPVNQVRRDVTNHYRLTDQAQESLYRTPTYYDTYKNIPFGAADWAGMYLGGKPEWNRRFDMWRGKADNPADINVRNVYSSEPESRLPGVPASSPDYPYAQDFRLMPPEQTLLHEFIHSQQNDNPDVNVGMQRMDWPTNPTDLRAREQGIEQYGQMNMLQSPSLEAHAAYAERPWAMPAQERERFYPGIFKQDMEQQQLPQPDPRVEWRGPW